MNEEIENEMICFCSKVRKKEIEEAIKSGARTLEDIRVKTNTCTVGRCKALSPRKKCCTSEIRKILKEYSIECP